MNFLGIDIGTTSVKLALFDDALTELRSITADYTLVSSGDRVEFDAEKYWEIISSAVETIRAEYQIDALAIDTQCETMIVTDENGYADFRGFYGNYDAEIECNGQALYRELMLKKSGCNEFVIAI